MPNLFLKKSTMTFSGATKAIPPSYLESSEWIVLWLDEGSSDGGPVVVVVPRGVASVAEVLEGGWLRDVAVVGRRAGGEVLEGGWLRGVVGRLGRGGGSKVIEVRPGRLVGMREVPP